MCICLSSSYSGLSQKAVLESLQNVVAVTRRRVSADQLLRLMERAVVALPHQVLSLDGQTRQTQLLNCLLESNTVERPRCTTFSCRLIRKFQLSTRDSKFVAVAVSYFLEVADSLVGTAASAKNTWHKSSTFLVQSSWNEKGLICEVSFEHMACSTIKTCSVKNSIMLNRFRL